MAWRDEAEHSLPRPKPSEPANLRADILDELADHLALAADRERQLNANEEDGAIWVRVLEKFGDPNALARRLWWDAMKETVMREWIKTGLMILMGVAILLFMAFIAKQIQVMNETMLRLGKQTSAAMSTTRLRITVNRGTENGPPVPGIRGSLEGAIFRNEEESVDLVTDTKGQVEVGPIQFGNFTIDLWDPETKMRHNRRVTLFSGETALNIVAPALGSTNVTFDFGAVSAESDLPQGLAVDFNSYWGDETNRWKGEYEALVSKEGTLAASSDPSFMNVIALVNLFNGSYALRTTYQEEEQPLSVPGTTMSIRRITPVLKITREQLEASKPTDRPGRSRQSPYSAAIDRFQGGWVWVEGPPQDTPSNILTGFAPVETPRQDKTLSPNSAVTLAVELPEPLRTAYARIARIHRMMKTTPDMDPDLALTLVEQFPNTTIEKRRPISRLDYVNLKENVLYHPLCTGNYSRFVCEKGDGVACIDTPMTREEAQSLPEGSVICLALSCLFDRVQSYDVLMASAFTSPWAPKDWPNLPTPDSTIKGGFRAPGRVPVSGNRPASAAGVAQNAQPDVDNPYNKTPITINITEQPFWQAGVERFPHNRQWVLIDATAWLRDASQPSPENGILLYGKDTFETSPEALNQAVFAVTECAQEKDIQLPVLIVW